MVRAALTGFAEVLSSNPVQAWIFRRLDDARAELLVVFHFTRANRSVHGLIEWKAVKTGKLRLVIVFTICTDQFSFPKIGRESLKLVSKIGLNKWNINFPLEHSDQKIKIIIIKKTGLLFQMFGCSSRKVCFGTNHFYSCFIYIGHPEFPKSVGKCYQTNNLPFLLPPLSWVAKISIISEQTVNIHKMYLLWWVGFRHQRGDYQQLIVESSAE